MKSNNDFKEQEYKESQDDEIDSLFDDARRKLDTVEKESKDKKKQIVVDLAKNLEGKIPTDTIAIEIVNQLRGSVSERFVRECLPEKYKQKHKVENAKKQKKLNQEENNNLAAETPLDNKEVIIVDADGSMTSTFFKEDEDDQPSKTATDDPIDDKTFTRPSSSSQQLEQEHNIKYDDSHSDNKIKDLDHNEFNNQNLIQDNILDKPSQLTDFSSKEIITEEEAITYKPSYDNDTDTLPFEYSKSYKEIRNYLTPLYSKIGDNGRIWFSGRINKNTGEVISHNFGRLNQQQRRRQQPDDESIESTDRGDVYKL